MADEKTGASALDVIRRRKSSRNYLSKEIEADKAARLNELFANLKTGPMGSACRFALADAGAGGIGKMMGTYGMIRGARQFIVGAVKKGARDLEDFGYQFERIVLLATELELGTCWLGVTFNRSIFADKIKLRPDELMPAVSPVGYASDKNGVIDHAARMMVGSKNRKAWSELFFDGSFKTPLAQSSAGAYGEALEMVRLGPSATNKQPWRIARKDGAYHLYLQRSKGYAKGGDSIDLQRLDMGIAMQHFERACVALGMSGKWVVAAAPDLGPLPEDTAYIATWRGE